MYWMYKGFICWFESNSLKSDNVIGNNGSCLWVRFPPLLLKIKDMKKDKTWLIFPMLAYVKYVDGTNEITVGWLNKTYSIKW